MIYLEKSRLLFLKPFKVAGTSFEIALSKYTSEKDILSSLQAADSIRESLGFRGPQNHRYTFLEFLALAPRSQASLVTYKHKRIKFPMHADTALARERLGADRFDKAFKVSIVRNPYDYLISHYFHANRGIEGDSVSFAQWCRKNPWVFTRNDQFYFLNSREQIDYYIRYESFDEDIKGLEDLRPELSGLSETFSGISANSETRPKNASIERLFRENDHLIRAVDFFQKHHIKKFGYVWH